MQQAQALEAIDRAEFIAVSIVVLCELVWVLDRSYAARRDDIAATLRSLLVMPKIMVDRPAAAAGLSLLDAGGDFADAVIAYDGKRLGGSRFVSFDKRAVKRLVQQGVEAELL